MRHGITLAIVGAPNVGKSTLMNFLAKRDIAITSEIAGTTRDIIEAYVDIGGYPFILSDTAGIHECSENIIEEEGISRAKTLACNADMNIVLFDVENIHDHNLSKFITPNTLVVVNKIDLKQIGALRKKIQISLKQNIGLDNLLSAIKQKAADIFRPTEMPAITCIRHRRHLELALESLDRCDVHGDIVLAAEDIRLTTRHLSLLTGKIEIEEVLGEIFSNFCIGK